MVLCVNFEDKQVLYLYTARKNLTPILSENKSIAELARRLMCELYNSCLFPNCCLSKKPNNMCRMPPQNSTEHLSSRLL